MSDPNWFYSTLAQSTAAIVGLAGGFFVQRLLVQRSEVGAERERLRVRLLELMTSANQTRTLAKNVGDSMSRAAKKAATLRKEQRELRYTATELHSFTHSQNYGERKIPEGLEGDIEAWINESIEVATALESVLPATESQLLQRIRQGSLDDGGNAWLREPNDPTRPDGIGMENFWDWMPFQRNFAAQQFREIDRAVELLAGEFAIFRARLIPRTFLVLLGILGGLLIAGVIAPLFFLTGRSEISKVIFIGLFVLLSLGFLGYVAFELNSLRDAVRLDRDDAL